VWLNPSPSVAKKSTWSGPTQSAFSSLFISTFFGLYNIEDLFSGANDAGRVPAGKVWSFRLKGFRL
jgi:hypothetical protein